MLQCGEGAICQRGATTAHSGWRAAPRWLSCAMAYGVFIHRSDSIYDDSPTERYQFPPQYRGQASQSVRGRVVYYGPRKGASARGYFAAARVERTISDLAEEPGSYDRLVSGLFSQADLGRIVQVLNDVRRREAA